LRQKLRPLWIALLFGLVPTMICTLCSGSIMLADHGFFRPWEKVEGPIGLLEPGERIDRLLGPSSQVLRVQSTQGRTFQVGLPSKYFPAKDISTWHTAPNEVLSETGIPSRCNFYFWPPPLIPGILHGVVDNTHLRGCYRGEGMGQTDFVLLGDGTLWKWSYEQEGIFIDRPELPILPSAGIGLMIGGLFWLAKKNLPSRGLGGDVSSGWKEVDPTSKRPRPFASEIQKRLFSVIGGEMQTNRSFSTIVKVVLAIFAIILFVYFLNSVITSLPPQTSSTIANNPYPATENSAYPIPITPSPDARTPSISIDQRHATEAVSATQTMEVFAPTFAAIVTAQAAKPATPVPNVSGSCYTDEKKIFSLQLPPGWYGIGSRGYYTFQNFPLEESKNEGPYPPGGIAFHIQYPKLQEGQTVESWLADWSARLKKEPSPYQMGEYAAFRYDVSGDGSGGVNILVPFADSRILFIDMMKAGTPEFQNALSILSTLSNSVSCL